MENKCKPRKNRSGGREAQKTGIKLLPHSLAVEIYGKLEQSNCLYCGKKLPKKITHYTHDGGWIVRGFLFRQWLSINCRGCRKHNALWRLGYTQEKSEVL